MEQKKKTKAVSKSMKATKTREIEAILKRPYARILIPEEDGGYSCEVLEFQGCYSFGDTPDEAMRHLNDSAYNWIEAALSQKQTIPEPLSEGEPSGKVLLRLPRNQHKKAIQNATRDRVSLNTYIVEAVAARNGAEEFAARLLASMESRFLKAMPTININVDARQSTDRYVSERDGVIYLPHSQ